MAMHYVLRDAEGRICSLHRDPVEGSEPVPAHHPEVQAFLSADEAQRSFASMDADLVRVLEDLIDVLIQRNVLRVTDLPVEAQQKLYNRKHARSHLRHHALSLFGDGPDAEGLSDTEVVPTDWKGL